MLFWIRDIAARPGTIANSASIAGMCDTAHKQPAATDFRPEIPAVNGIAEATATTARTILLKCTNPFHRWSAEARLIPRSVVTTTTARPQLLYGLSPTSTLHIV